MLPEIEPKLRSIILHIATTQVHLSTRPAGEDATVGSDEAWEAATAALTQALDEVGLSYEVDEGEGGILR